MTIKEIKRLCAYWQRALRLQDWDIEFTVIDDPRHTDFGEGTHNPKYCLSKVKILHPKHIPESWWGCKDVEVTIVHELLHIRFLYGGRGDMSEELKNQEEVAIETTAKLLVALRRGIEVEELV